jgi:hypothetical protein
MIEGRVNHVTRKRVSQMSAEEMRSMLLTSETTGAKITLGGADFCFGIGINQRQAEKALKQQKQLKGGLRTDLFSYAQPAAQSAPSAQL